MPCQHILCVIASARDLNIPELSLISPIYSVERFVQAFPDEMSFYPNDSSTYSRNLTVVPQEAQRKRGHPRTHRYLPIRELRSRGRRTRRSSFACSETDELKNTLDNILASGGSVSSQASLQCVLEAFFGRRRRNGCI